MIVVALILAFQLGVILFGATTLLAARRRERRLPPLHPFALSARDLRDRGGR